MPGSLGKNSTHGNNSNFASPDLLIHPTDWSQTLGTVRTPCGWTLAQRSSPKMLSITRNQKSTAKNTSPRVHPKTTKLKGFRGVCGGEITKQRYPWYSYVIPTNKAQKIHSQIFVPKILKKGSENQHEKIIGEPKETQGMNSEPSIKTMKDSLQKLATSQHPSLSGSLKWSSS